MPEKIEVTDVVAVTTELPEQGLSKGHVGTVVEELDEDTYKIGFIDKDGHTYAQCPILGSRLMRLQYEPAA